jgi:hypothetical protein
MELDPASGGIGATILLVVAGLIRLLYHKRIRSQCCGVTSSFGIDDTTPKNSADPVLTVGQVKNPVDAILTVREVQEPALSIKNPGEPKIERSNDL